MWQTKRRLARKALSVSIKQTMHSSGNWCQIQHFSVHSRHKAIHFSILFFTFLVPCLQKNRVVHDAASHKTDLVSQKFSLLNASPQNAKRRLAREALPFSIKQTMHLSGNWRQIQHSLCIQTTRRYTSLSFSRSWCTSYRRTCLSTTPFHTQLTQFPNNFFVKRQPASDIYKLELLVSNMTLLVRSVSAFACSRSRHNAMGWSVPFFVALPSQPIPRKF